MNDIDLRQITWGAGHARTATRRTDRADAYNLACRAPQWLLIGSASALEGPRHWVVSNCTWVVSNRTAIAPALRTIATVAGVHLSTFLNSDTLDSQATNAIFHAHMTVVSGGNVRGLATIRLVGLFVCLATSLPGKQAEWFHS